jgi:hypothetical protein
MACLLYRKGDTHEWKGTKCEIGRFQAHEVDIQLTNGWYTSPEEAYEEVDDGLQEEEIEEIETEEEPENEAPIDYESFKTPELRLIAKEACIDNWKKARRSTLLNKLKEV